MTSRELHLNEALRAEGLILIDGRARVTGWRASAWLAGGSAAVMLKDDGDDEARQAVERVLERLAADPGGGIDRVLDRSQAAAAGGYPDAEFVVSLKPGVRTGGSFEPPVLRAGEVRGTHGTIPEDSAMDAAFHRGSRYSSGTPPGPHRHA
jgi:hypothetical protein